jgi:hypothetical protein
MATAAVSGALALVSQYINEGWHQIPGAPNATNVLLRAFAVHSTVNGAPSPSAGYGLPALERALVFPEDFPKRGLRFVTGMIAPEREAVMYVEIENALEPLVITLVWDDTVLPLADDTLFPIVLDLDLFVIGPDKRVTYGNLGREEDSLGTIEK